MLDHTHSSSGTAHVVGFARADELIAAMLAAAAAGLEAAIAERLWRQEISDRGDAAATLFLDGPRLAALLRGPASPPPPELLQLRAQAERRDHALLRQLEATPDHGPPLARAVRRWRLSPEAIRVVAAMLGTELSPRLARLAAFLGGDASRPGVSVEAIGALLGAEARPAAGDTAGEAGVVAAMRELSPGAPLHELSLVLLRLPDAPLLRRQLWLAPRVVELALGRAALDEAAGAAAIAPPPPGSVASADTPTGLALREAIEAVRRRPARPVVGVIRAGRAGAIAALARVLDDQGARLLAAELSSLADDARLGALAREAALQDAAIAVRVDVTARDAARAARAVDRLAALAPVFLVGAAEPEPVLPLAVGALAIDIPPPGPAELAAAVGGAFTDLLTAGEIEQVAAQAPLDPGAAPRAAAAIAARPYPADRPAAVIRALAEQHAPPAGPAARALPIAPPPPAPQLAAAIDTAARRWAQSAPPRRLRILIDGRPGTGKTTTAAAIAARLGLPAFAIDPPRAARGGEPDPALASVLAAVAANAAALVVENVDLLGARRARATPEPAFQLGWLARLDGLLILTTRDPITTIELGLRRELDLAITVPFPDVAERLRLWQGMLARRGARVEPAELEALARDFPFTAAQIERVAALAGEGGPALRQEAERRSVLITNQRSGVEVD
ncbi:MAG TPA: AAA family ATPase [Kofleriaceae bacterium]|nr:AAA family ATPase [Kofleriaceae bacterium]